MPRSFILPGQPLRYARSHEFKIKHTKLEVELDFEQKAITGTALHVVEPVGAPINSIELDSAELFIKSVTVNQREARYQTKARSLRIELGFELTVGNAADVQIQYSAKPRRGLYFREPTAEFPDRKVHAFTQGQSEDSKFWYPCYYYPNMRTETETLITAPSNMIVVSNGKLLEQKQVANGKKRTWHFQQQVPHPAYLLSLVAGDFKSVQELHRGVELQYVYPEGKDEEAKRSFGNTGRMIDFFEQVTGQEYPYPKYAQSAVADFMFGGMENIGATTLTYRTLHDARAHLDFTSDNLVSHELAHQWFGDLLTCKDWSHAWLNEGFASYFNALWVEHDQGARDFQYYMYNPFEEGLNIELERYHRAIVNKHYWDADELFDAHTYQKGAWVLHGLRGFLGDQLFFQGIKNYVAAHKNSNVETADFRKALERVSGKDLESFFDQWLYSAGYPVYSASYNWNEDQKLVELELEQTNAGSDDTPLFTGPIIELRFTFPDGSNVSKKVGMRDKKQVFYFAFGVPPVNVNIDPQSWILKKLKFEKPKEMYLYQLENDDNVMEKVRAAGELSSFHTQDVVDALCKVIDSNDDFWALRLEAAKALGKMETKEALEALLRRVNHKDHRVRRGVAFALRNFTNLGEEERGKAVEALINILENDEAYFARGYAAGSLGFYKGSERAFAAMKRALEQESINDIVRYRVFQGFSEMNDPRAIALAIEELEKGKWHQGRGMAASCLGKIGKGDPGALKALLLAERIPNVYVKDEAASALGELGDTAIIGDLEAWLSREPEGRTRRRLREAIYLLKTKLLEAEKLAKLNLDLEKLETESKKSEAKLSALEARVERAS